MDTAGSQCEANAGRSARVWAAIPMLCATLNAEPMRAHPQETSDHPCTADAAFRALDFWTGAWSLHSHGREIGASVIERLGAGCAVLESYRQGDGYSGTSLSYVDPIDGRWRQIWIDSAGAVSEFHGEPDPKGGVRFAGETRSPSGEKSLRLVKLEPEKGGRVLQLSRISRDGGRIWRDHYSLEYRPGSGNNVSAHCSAPPDPAAEAAVRAVATGIIAADNASALDRVLAFYHPDAVLLPPNARPVGGLRHIRPRYEALFSEYTPAIDAHIDRSCVASDIALVEGNNGGWLIARGDGNDRALDDAYWMVLRREASSWRIAVLAWRPRISATSPRRRQSLSVGSSDLLDP